METLDWRLNAYRPDLADIRLRGRVEAQRFVSPDDAEIGVASTPLLRHPKPDAAMDSQLLLGERLHVFESKGGWSWVQSQTDGYVGYVEDSAVTPIQPTPTHRVSAAQALVLSDEKQVGRPLMSLSLGARVRVQEEGPRFSRIAGGGWIFSKHLRPLAEASADWTTVAEQFLGLPYMWGGRGHQGVDCSGLVQISLAACGIPFLRDSDQQAELGIAVSVDPDQWRRGDLVFVRGHVMIVQDSERLVHATGYHWSVVSEARTIVLERLRRLELPVTSVRRPG